MLALASPLNVPRVTKNRPCWLEAKMEQGALNGASGPRKGAVFIFGASIKSTCSDICNASRRDVSRLPGGRSDGKEQSKNNRLSPLIKIA